MVILYVLRVNDRFVLNAGLVPEVLVKRYVDSMAEFLPTLNVVVPSIPVDTKPLKTVLVAPGLTT
jgi:hypothetical protein